MSPISPTRQAVMRREIDKRCDAARKVGDIAELQRCMAELTTLDRACHGKLA
ncbi:MULTISPECIES: hypothetical protein [unclassified Bradyrhizobium]|uniref:hypothetical protein n=1 Tax=unclassified Bradyrhizobium TaxID=2631580 RepID=UPI0028E7BF02|nr:MULTISPECIES: hypothetical protein [unclassified Bradyrhizobium]